MSSKLIITNYTDKKNNKYILTAYRQFDRIFDLDFMSTGGNDLGNIYVGLVRDIASNINAAFIQYTADKKGYLSLNDNKHFIFLNKKNTEKLCQGDLILVQVEKEPIKTKDAVLTSHISIPGIYGICSYGKEIIGFSKKINEKSLSEDYSSLNDFKSKSEAISKKYMDDNIGFIIRTEAAKASPKAIENDLKNLKNTLIGLINDSYGKKTFSCLYTGKPSYISIIEKNLSETEEIITDIPAVYDNIKSSIKTDKLRLYEDYRISLSSLYGIEAAVNEALNKKVWLKSGGFLIIEQTEAMTVIDVNTGKFEKGSDSENTFLKVNKEAASEIGRQLRLRNLSGIIIIDFIDLKEDEHTKELLKYFSEVLNHDPVKTVLVDITKLGLAEVTRKKTKMPLSQLLG